MFAYCNNNPVSYKDLSGKSGTLAAQPETTTYGDVLASGGGGVAIAVVSVVAIITFGKSICTVVADAADHLWNRISMSYAAAKSRIYNSPEEVHHLVAKKARNAAFAAEILNQILPDGVENPINKISIKTGLHRRLHTNLYYYVANSLVINAYLASDDPARQQENVVIALGLLRGIVSYLNIIAPY